MSSFNTELYKALASDSSIDEIVRSEIESCLNFLLKTELTNFLDYEPYDTNGYNTGNSRNGYYARTITTRYGDIEVQIPRDRNGEFKHQTIKPYKRNTDDLETTILQLYSKGITTSEISDLIEKMYGHAYTPATISNISRAVEDHVKEFHERDLNKRYAVVYMDATYLNVRRDSVSKEALHILVGIIPEGFKEVLDYRLYPTECAENYKETYISEAVMKSFYLSTMDCRAFVIDALRYFLMPGINPAGYISSAMSFDWYATKTSRK